MLRMCTVEWLILTILTLQIGLVGCDREEAEKHVRDATTRAAQQVEEGKIVADAQRYLRAVELRDLEALRTFCTEDTASDYGQIMRCYYETFAIETTDSAPAARDYLSEQQARNDNSPAKIRALAALARYFDAKGTIRTKEIAGGVLCFALEAKFPHQGAVLGMIVSRELGLFDEKTPLSSDPPSTQPTTQASADPRATR